MIAPEVKKSINLYVPLLIAGIVGFTAYKRKAKWQTLLIMMVATWLIVWLITRHTVKLVGTLADRPNPINIPTNIGGPLPTNFDANRWAKMLRDDMYTVFSFRDHDLYASVAAMNDSQLAAINNSWNRLYYIEHSETLLEAMRAEMYGNNIWDNTGRNAENIMNRLTLLMG